MSGTKTKSDRPRTPKPAPANDGPMRVYILLDRSQSMAAIWGEALGSINSYVKGLAEDAATQACPVTLATFDRPIDFAFEVIRKGVEAKAWKAVTSKEADPRGMTPLYDAVGQLMGLAELDSPKLATLVIMTDGRENASRELKKADAATLLDRARAKGWQVLHLGVDFDAFEQAADLGTQMGSTLNASGANLAGTAPILRRMTQSYAASGQAQSFTAEDRAKTK